MNHLNPYKMFESLIPKDELENQIDLVSDYLQEIFDDNRIPFSNDNDIKEGSFWEFTSAYVNRPVSGREFVRSGILITLSEKDFYIILNFIRDNINQLENITGNKITIYKTTPYLRTHYGAIEIRLSLKKSFLQKTRDFLLNPRSSKGGGPNP